MNVHMLTPAWVYWTHRLRRPIFQGVVVLAVVFAAIIFGLASATRRVDSALLLAAILGGLVFLFWWRIGTRLEPWILAIVLSGGLINLFSLPTGTESRIVISLVLGIGLLGIWLLHIVLARKRPLSTPINKPILVFAMLNIVSYGWSLLFRDPLLYVSNSFGMVQIASLLVNLTLVLLSLAVANLVSDLRTLKQLTAMLIGMGVLFILLFLSEIPLQQYVLTNGARGLFGTWVATFAYALALYNDDLRLYQRALLLVLVALLVYRFFVVGMSWVSGWLPLGASCALVTFFRSRRLFLTCILCGLLYFGINFEYYFDNIVVAEEEGGSGTERVGLWMNNLNHVANHPLFGMGPAGYALYNMTYHPEDARSTHNNYFDLLAQTGIAGTIAFIWLMATFIRIGHQTRRLVAGRRNFEEAFANATFAGCFAMLVAMMLGDWVLPFAYNQTISGFDNALYSWVFMGALVSLYRRLRAETAGIKVYGAN